MAKKLRVSLSFIKGESSKKGKKSKKEKETSSTTCISSTNNNLNINNINNTNNTNNIKIAYSNEFLQKYLKKHNLTAINIYTLFRKFYDNFMITLDFLDKSTLDIYSEGFVFAYFKIKVNKKTTETNTKILKKAVERCEIFLKNQEEEVITSNVQENVQSHTTNLFSLFYEIKGDKIIKRDLGQ
ncbi:hypothetical protein EHP00_1361 [Ecytonucleospora hepatopenaei]|uniref:Uncharacterized protein n=1 Tax=Ecytonucleospora hepatopenaei TaxID=646526 RepID=A0A1W0E334_9MICR|nr:hypothetical protein EHP00_1361 [Ecytonucleospora hepatopenaei]